MERPWDRSKPYYRNLDPRISNTTPGFVTVSSMTVNIPSLICVSLFTYGMSDVSSFSLVLSFAPPLSLSFRNLSNPVLWYHRQ